MHKTFCIISYFEITVGADNGQSITKYDNTRANCAAMLPKTSANLHVVSEFQIEWDFFKNQE